MQFILRKRFFFEMIRDRSIAQIVCINHVYTPSWQVYTVCLRLFLYTYYTKFIIYIGFNRSSKLHYSFRKIG